MADITNINMARLRVGSESLKLADAMFHHMAKNTFICVVRTSGRDTMSKDTFTVYTKGTEDEVKAITGVLRREVDDGS